MADEMEQKILSFLRRCQNTSSKAANIAHNLGLRSGMEIVSVLQRMRFKGLIQRVGSQWHLCQVGASGTGDSKESSDASPDSQSPVVVAAAGVRGTVGHDDRTTSSSPAEPSRRRSSGTVSYVIFSR